MKDRIKQIIDHEQLAPSSFADKLQLGRAVVSHILNGRNNPSLDVVTRILTKLDYINPDWLITGTGDMYKPGYGKNPDTSPQPIQSNNVFQNSQPDLFSQNPISVPDNTQKTEYCKEIVVEQPQMKAEDTENKTIIYQKAPERKVSKIIIYYSDNTFETFNADNKPL